MRESKNMQNYTRRHVSNPKEKFGLQKTGLQANEKIPASTPIIVVHNFSIHLQQYLRPGVGNLRLFHPYHLAPLACQSRIMPQLCGAYIS